jgi:2-amino-4-hydroxy-6-hydroxymethyldihydropteridine diphosphokinase
VSPGAPHAPGQAPPGPDWVFVGLGGNLGTEPEILARFDDACWVLAARAALAGQLRRSPLYRSPPAGPVAAQPDFLNMVAGFPPRPGLTPRALFSLLQELEARHGRLRDVPQGPRTLDLDLLLFGQTVLAEPDLVVPHPRMGHRAFVLQPLLDLLAQPLTRVPPPAG